jgi:hypothetical protein
LITPVEHKNPDKAAQKNKDLKVASNYWTISEVEFVSKEELDVYRTEGDENSYYLRNFPV